MGTAGAFIKKSVTDLGPVGEVPAEKERLQILKAEEVKQVLWQRA